MSFNASSSKNVITKIEMHYTNYISILCVTLDHFQKYHGYIKVSLLFPTQSLLMRCLGSFLNAAYNLRFGAGVRDGIC